MPKICPTCDAIYPDANAFCPVDGTTLHVVDLDGGLIGSVIADRYLVTDLLGEGGMGKVYLARHVRLPQQAAIKVLRTEMVRDPAAVARFNREASNASRIDDDNVARVYDFGEATGGTVYLAMEYVAGRTLRDIILDEGALSPRRTADLVEQTARALDAAHRLKIIHRDLKPDNVMVVVAPDGRDKVKVVDFGIARAFGAGDGGLTKTGFVVGTPEFMSPEQLTGGALDARSDVYALALLAFQCLTASLPFGGDTPEKSMTARLTTPPRPLSDVTGQVWPDGVQAAFDSALARDPDKRPASAGEFARQLRAAIEGAANGSNATAARVETAKPTPVVVPTAAKGAEGATEAPRSPTSARLPMIVGAVVVIAGGAAAWMRFGGGATAVGPTEAPARVAAESLHLATGTRTDSVRSASPASEQQPPTASPPPAKTPVKTPVAAVVQAPPRASEPAVAAPGPTASQTMKTEVADESSAPVQILDSLSVLLRTADASRSRGIASALRDLSPRLRSPTLRTRMFFRLIDANVNSGDLRGACSALTSARGTARGAQQVELSRYEKELGCD